MEDILSWFGSSRQFIIYEKAFTILGSYSTYILAFRFPGIYFSRFIILYKIKCLVHYFGTMSFEHTVLPWNLQYCLGKDILHFIILYKIKCMLALLFWNIFLEHLVLCWNNHCCWKTSQNKETYHHLN